MNDNHFDSNRSEQDRQNPSDVGGFDVYSKQYTPSEDGYTEHKERYSTGRTPRDREDARRDIHRGNRKIFAAVAITLAVLLVCSAAIFVSAKIAFSYYDGLYREYIEELEKGNQTGGDSEMTVPDATEEGTKT